MQTKRATCRLSQIMGGELFCFDMDEQGNTTGVYQVMGRAGKMIHVKSIDGDDDQMRDPKTEVIRL